MKFEGRKDIIKLQQIW